MKGEAVLLTLRGRGAILVGTKRVGGVVAHRLAREGVNLAIVYRTSRQEAERLNSEVGGLTERTCPDRRRSERRGRRCAHRAVRQANVWETCRSWSTWPQGSRATRSRRWDGAAWDEAMSFAKGSYLLNVHAARRMMGNEGPTRGHIVQFSDWAAGKRPTRTTCPT